MASVLFRRWPERGNLVSSHRLIIRIQDFHELRSMRMQLGEARAARAGHGSVRPCKASGAAWRADERGHIGVVGWTLAEAPRDLGLAVSGVRRRSVKRASSSGVNPSRGSISITWSYDVARLSTNAGMDVCLARREALSSGIY